MKRVLTAMIAVLLTATSVCSLTAKEPRAIKTLIVAGQDGSHYWRGAADCMRRMLVNSGRFTVDTVETPDWGEDITAFHPDFRSYDLVIVNYGGVEWSGDCKRDFESYVRNGGGVVFLHSSIIPMENWKEYNEMTGLGAWNGRDDKWGPYLFLDDDGKYIYDYTPGWAGHHGLQHGTVIETRAADHPIMKGVPAKWRHFKDEIYTRLRGPARNIEILSTTYDDGRNEPIMWTVRYGEGRAFVDVLGHCGNDPDMTYSMTCTGFQITFIRGCEWAATGAVTIPVPDDFPTEEYYTLRMDFAAPLHTVNK